MPVLGNPQDDTRVAAQLKVTRALYLFTTALATVAGAGALVTFILGSFHHTGWFLSTVGLAFLCGFASIYFGAQGIRDIYIAGYDRDWKEDTGKTKLSVQALFLMLAALITAASLAVARLTANKNNDPLPAAVSAQATATAKLAAELAGVTHNNVIVTQREVQTLNITVRNLESQITLLTVQCWPFRHKSAWRDEHHWGNGDAGQARCEVPR